MVMCYYCFIIAETTQSRHVRCVTGFASCDVVNIVRSFSVPHTLHTCLL